MHELRRAEHAAVRVPVVVRFDRGRAPHDAAVLRLILSADLGGRLLLLLIVVGLGDGLLLLLVGLLGRLVGGLFLLLLLHGLLLLLLLHGLLLHRLLLLLLLLTDLGDAVVIVVAATD